MAYLDTHGLTTLWSKIKNYITSYHDSTKQNTLVSGTNIKTVNSNSLLGSGNVSVGTYSKPSGGIPKTDLASAVQTSLGRADTALQSAPVTSVNSKTGAVSLSASDVGAAATSHTHTKSQITDFPTLATVATSGSYNDLSNKPTIPSAITVDTAISSTSTNPVQNKVIKTALDGKVSTVSGKGLSTNDYTTTEKNKLAGIASGAEVNVQADWNQTNTGADDYIKNKPTIPAAAIIYHNLGQNTNGAIDQKVVTDAINNSLQFGANYNDYIEVDIESEDLDAVDLARYSWVSDELNGKVPTTRKVNGKALSSDVTLMSADILVAGDRTIDDAFSTVNTNINNLSTSKQATLVSGTNIKTINSTSLLGSGNITIQESAITDARIEEICDIGGGGFALTVQASYLPYQFTIYYIDNTSETFSNISDLNGVHENVVAFRGEAFLGVFFDKTYTFDIYDEQSEQTTSETSATYSFRGVKRVIMSEDMSITNMVDED